MIELYNNKENCCGCTACENSCPKNAIVMKADEEGFLYPAIDAERCIECKACLKVCPFKNELINNISKAYAVKNKNENIRMTSSSGGIFTVISDYILEREGTIYGAVFNNEFGVYHSRAINKADREAMKGSKYLQSDLKDTYFNIKKDLQEGKYVLFTGTSCQTAGLYNFIPKNLDCSKLYVCDIICHGAPSPLMWNEYIRFLKKKYSSEINSINFKDKESSWHYPQLKIKMNKLTYKARHDEDDYLKLFFDHYILRPSCHNCKFTNLQRQSDITMADFWGIEDCNPEFDDDKGISFVLINTDKGKRIFNDISEELIFTEVNIEDGMKKQPSLISPPWRNSRRGEFWRDYNKKGFVYILKKYRGHGFKAKLKKKIKLFLNKI